MKKESTWQFEVSTWKEASRGPHHRRESPPVNRRAIPKTAGLVNCKSGKVLRVFCEVSHTSESCQKAQGFNFAEKRNLAVKRGCSFACLRPGHRERRCRAVLRCVLCNGRHVSVMCMSTDKMSAKTEAPVVKSSLSNIDCSNQVFLQTLMVTLRGEGDRRVGVPMDPWTQ